MLRKLSFLVLAGGLLLGMSSCETLTSPNFNFGDLDELVESPSPSGLFTAATGMLIIWRQYIAQGSNDLYAQLGLLGREGYTLDIADPRFEAEMLSPQLSADSPAFGGNHWSEPYENVRVGDIILSGIENSTPPLSANDAAWLRGFVKTVLANDFMTIVLLRDTNCGCPIQASEDLLVPAPAVSKDQVFSHIVQLLDEGAADLQSASGPAPFGLSSGFDGITGVVEVGFFRDAAGFRQFNRALRARVAMHLQDWNGVLTALGQSFISAGAPMNLGVFHTFTQQSGDITNGMAQLGGDPNLRAHPEFKADVELKGDGTPDDRFVRKTRVVDTRPFNGICLGDPSPTPWPPDPSFVEDPGGGTVDRTCDLGFNIYPEVTSPVSIIRNEELLLMRAEANINLGNLAGAETDINLVRAVSGGLAPVTLTSANAIDQLLSERRFSLWWEGHRWLDMRRYNRLGELPLDKPTHGVVTLYPLPERETTARQ